MVSTRMRMSVRRLDRAATTSRVVNARSLQEDPMVCAPVQDLLPHCATGAPWPPGMGDCASCPTPGDTVLSARIHGCHEALLGSPEGVSTVASVQGTQLGTRPLSLSIGPAPGFRVTHSRAETFEGRPPRPDVPRPAWLGVGLCPWEGHRTHLTSASRAADTSVHPLQPRPLTWDSACSNSKEEACVLVPSGVVPAHPPAHLVLGPAAVAADCTGEQVQRPAPAHAAAALGAPSHHHPPAQGPPKTQGLSMAMTP